MTRYTINIGDDFPLGNGESGDRGPPSRHGGRRRHGLFLRVLFFLAVAAIVLAHPIKTLLVVGLVLFLSRSGVFAGLRERLRDAWRSGATHDWRREAEAMRDRWDAWRSRSRQRCGGRGRPGGGGDDESDRYRGFV